MLCLLFSDLVLSLKSLFLFFLDLFWCSLFKSLYSVGYNITSALWFFIFWPQSKACGILARWPGIKFTSSSVEGVCVCVCVCVKVTQSFLTLCDPINCSPPGFSVHGILQARILEWVAMSSSKGSSQPRDRTQSPTLQVDSLQSEPPGKPKNTRVGSLPFLQGIFPTQESKWGLLHCRWIIY